MSTNLAEMPTTMPLAFEPPAEIPDFPSWCKRTEASLEITRHVNFEEWAQAFEILDKTTKGHQWQIGDMLNEGEQRFGDDCYQVIEPDEEDQRDDDGKGETYRSYQWVSRQIPVVHRCTAVPWSLHRDVAALDAPERDRWLALAAAKKLTRRGLKREMDAVKSQAQKDREHVAEHVRNMQQKAMLIHCDHSIAIQSDLKKKCPMPKIGDRVYSSIIQELEDIKQDIQTANIEVAIKAAVDNGYQTVPDIVKHLGLQLDDVRRVLPEMVEKTMLEVRSVEESRQDGRRGVMVNIYAVNADYVPKSED